MSPSVYTPRLSVAITEHQRNELDRILSQHGLQRAVFSIIIDDLIEAVNNQGQDVIAGLVARSLKLNDICSWETEGKNESR